MSNVVILMRAGRQLNILEMTPGKILIDFYLLRRKNGIVGANSCARATFDASIGIDVVDFAFADSVNGTFGKTCTASNARVGD